MRFQLKRYGLAVLATAVLAAGCRPGPENVDTVAKAPPGEKVTVEGRVSRVLGDCAYELGVEPVLTLCESMGQPPDEVAENDELRITGVTQELTRHEYELRSALTVPDDVFGLASTRTVLVIEKAEKLPPLDDLTPPRAPLVVPIL